jgi:hypothetical protein
MDWTDASGRLSAAQPARTVSALVASLQPGQHLLYARPLTEGVSSWRQSWSMQVRRRAAQWGALLATDPKLAPIAGAVAPHNYRGACCVGDSAIVYSKRP